MIMNRGTELVEMLTGNLDFLPTGIPKRPVEQTLSLYDSLIQWFSESVVMEREGTLTDQVTRRHQDRIRMEELPGQRRGGDSRFRDALWARLDQIRIPKLDRIRVRLEGRPGRIHEAEPVRGEPQKTVKKAGPVKPRPPKPARVPEPKVASGLTAKALPTPRESLKQPPKPVVTAAPPPPPKPLKVIRRRKEEQPKVFETPPRSFPKAMLEGISSALEEMGEHKRND